MIGLQQKVKSDLYKHNLLWSFAVCTVSSKLGNEIKEKQSGKSPYTTPSP